jgi:hypothetical protein
MEFLVGTPRHAAVLAAALLALLVPLTLEGAFWLFQLGPDWSGVFFWLWPSSLELMLLESRPPMSDVVMIYSISIGINVILYALIGSVRCISFFAIRWAN